MQQPEDNLIRTPDDLVALFHEAEKPRAAWRIGAEGEKFGVDAQSGAPLQYDGPHGVVRIFEALIRDHGWRPEREREDGPLIALVRGQASITLEPGAQLELSGAALTDVHAICAETREHLSELEQISREMNIVWLGIGFHPLAHQDELPWVPKQRYGVMREYLPQRGSGALDMMRRTATVQANYDYADERDAMRKLRVALRLSPLVHVMTANSPFKEARLAGVKSVRGDVWLRMDPARAGLIRSIWDSEHAGYQTYAEWALDAGMFLFKRGSEVIKNTGQTFRSFLSDGYQGHRATRADWKLHLNTLFPEVRLKNTLEVRGCDSLPASLACAVPALFAGILYDERALAEAEELTRDWSFDEVERARPELIRDGLAASLAGTPVRALAERVLDIAAGGLTRRAFKAPSGEDETVHLERLRALVNAGKTPADALTEGLSELGGSALRQEILQRSRL